MKKLPGCGSAWKKPSSKTIVSRRLAARVASAGRSIPGMVRSASFAIAISAPVLPEETAAPASPAFTAAMAMLIELDFLRMAALGLSPASTTSVNAA